MTSKIFTFVEMLNLCTHTISMYVIVCLLLSFSLSYKLHESSGYDSFYRPLKPQIQAVHLTQNGHHKMIWMLKKRNMKNLK